MRIPNLSLYLCMVEFETEYKFEFETANKIFHEYQSRFFATAFGILYGKLLKHIISITNI